MGVRSLLGRLARVSRSRLLGVVVMVLAAYAMLMLSDPFARKVGVHQDMAKRLGFYGVITVGAGLLIVSGGIDLSIGSVVGLGAVTFSLMLEAGWPAWRALAAVLVQSALIGLTHGLLVTRLGLQPFLVTLCGLFVYRGLAKWATWQGSLSSSRTVGLAGTALEKKEEVGGFDGAIAWMVKQSFGIPDELIVLIGLAVVLGLLLHASVYGRYLFAIGANEQAARYAGIPTDRYKILAYVICSMTAGLTGIIEVLDTSTADPGKTGNFYELYAITGAVLGGCSLRGGEGSVPGMVLGAAVLPLLRSLTIFAGIPGDLEYTVIGTALLVGTIADELLKRIPRDWTWRDIGLLIRTIAKWLRPLLGR
jgi:ribose transport system permease protein